MIDGTTTFSYREEGMPSESLASPEGRPATLSSTSIDREQILDAKKNIIPAASVIDEKASESASASVSANLAMNRMVDDIVGSEAVNEYEVLEQPRPTYRPQIPQTPPGYSFDESPIIKMGNDTSYGVMGTLTANDLVRETRNYSPQHTPSPILPSLYNSAFAPTLDDNISSRPTTAKGLSFPQQINGYHVSSSLSNIKDPSSMFSSPLSWNKGNSSVGIGVHHEITGRPSTIYSTTGHTFTDGDFISPVVFNESPWAGSGRSSHGILDGQTPQNGQCGG